MTLLTFRIIFAICLLLTMSQFSTSMTRIQRNDGTSVADAIKYLQELDSIYSHISRPRIMTRSNNLLADSFHPELQTAIKLLRLETIDRIYSKHTKPRFGKRNNIFKTLSDDNSREEDEPNWQSNLYAKR